MVPLLTLYKHILVNRFMLVNPFQNNRWCLKIFSWYHKSNFGYNLSQNEKCYQNTNIARRHKIQAFSPQSLKQATPLKLSLNPRQDVVYVLIKKLRAYLHTSHQICCRRKSRNFCAFHQTIQPSIQRSFPWQTVNFPLRSTVGVSSSLWPRADEACEC